MWEEEELLSAAAWIYIRVYSIAELSASTVFYIYYINSVRRISNQWYNWVICWISQAKNHMIVFVVVCWVRAHTVFATAVCMYGSSQWLIVMPDFHLSIRNSYKNQINSKWNKMPLEFLHYLSSVTCIMYFSLLKMIDYNGVWHRFCHDFVVIVIIDR